MYEVEKNLFLIYFYYTWHGDVAHPVFFKRRRFDDFAILKIFAI